MLGSILCMWAVQPRNLATLSNETAEIIIVGFSVFGSSSTTPVSQFLSPAARHLVVTVTFIRRHIVWKRQDFSP